MSTVNSLDNALRHDDADNHDVVFGGTTSGIDWEALGSISTVPIAPTQQSGYINAARLRPGWLDYEQAVVDSGHLAKYSPPSWSVDVPGRRFGSDQRQ